jgi:hypothetical protein
MILNECVYILVILSDEYYINHKFKFNGFQHSELLSKNKIVFIEENKSAMPLNIACLWWPRCHPTLQNPLSISLFGRLCFLSTKNLNVVVDGN